MTGYLTEAHKIRGLTGAQDLLHLGSDCMRAGASVHAVIGHHVTMFRNDSNGTAQSGQGQGREYGGK